MRTIATSRPSAGERMLQVTAEFGAGEFVIKPGRAGELYRMVLRYDAERNVPVHQYDARSGILRLGVESSGGAGIKVTTKAQMSQRAELFFAPEIPLALSANLGASDATLELGGLTLRSLSVGGGASRTTVNFSKPTRGECTSASFMIGAAELEVRGLANAGCRELRVEGGVGRVMLSFDGTWRQDTKAQVSLAMGGLTLRIPKGTGVQLVTSRFLAAFEAEGFTREGDTMTTPGFATATQKLVVELKASVTGVKVEWTP